MRNTKQPTFLSNKQITKLIASAYREGYKQCLMDNAEKQDSKMFTLKSKPLKSALEGAMMKSVPDSTMYVSMVRADIDEKSINQITRWLQNQ